MSENMKTVLVGTNGGTYIYMEYGAYLKILRYSKAGSIDGSRGVFLGKRDGDRVYIYEALEAMYYGDEGLEAPSFTRQSWERITEEIKEHYGDLRILGQYSTHPDIAPTEMDMAMQESFFDSLSDLLFIFDPVENVSEIYRFENRRFEPVKGIKLFDKYENELDMRIADSIMRPVNREFELRTKILSKFNKRLASQTRIYLIAFAVMLIAIIYLVFQNAEQAAKYEELSQSINDIQWVVNQQDKVLTELTQPTPEPTATPKTKKSTAR